MSAGRLRALVIGDPYFTVDDFRRNLSGLEQVADIAFHQIETTAIAPPKTDSESRLGEYMGVPSEIAAKAAGQDVLIVHGAAVSAEVFDENPRLRLVCCARGGPVNVDLLAATEAGVMVCTTPGKNAEAVAELTIAFVFTLIRRVPTALRHVRARDWRQGSTFDGREYFGREAQGLTLGLVGYGRVGHEVSRRARPLGMGVLAHDPYVGAEDGDKVEFVELADLLARSDVVSLHARLTAGNRHMMGAEQFGQMRQGSCFINTAREQLVDESALLASLQFGWLSGAALDVFEQDPSGSRNPLLDVETVIATPHLAGATVQTLDRGARMVVAAVNAFSHGATPPFVVNPRTVVPPPDAEPAGGTP
jgi:D-3-phosphoglycerate dehydrogenase